MSRVLLSWIVVAVALVAARADAITDAAGFEVRAWSVAEGLPRSTVEELATARDGSLWVGTRDGLARFDGVAFSPVRLDGVTNTLVGDLHVDPDGIVWAAYGDGTLARIEGRAVAPVARGESAAASVARAADGTLWIATGRGLLRLTPGAAAPSLAHAADAMRVVHVGRSGTVWAAGAGLVRARPSGVLEPLPWPPGCTVFALHEDAQGTLWAGSSCGLLARDPDGRERRWSAAQGLPNDRVRALAEDGAGRLWIGTLGGIARVDAAAVRPIAEAGQANVFALHVDREGSVWAGTATGLVRVRPRSIHLLSAAHGLPGGSARTVAQTDDGAVWVGTGVGLWRLQAGRAARVDGGLPGESILSVIPRRDGALYVAVRHGGISVGKDGALLPAVLAGQSVHVMLEDPAGDLWAGTPHGLARWRPSTGALTWVRDGLPSTDVRALARTPDGAVWAGTRDGLVRIDGDGAARIVGRAFAVRVLSVDDDGRLWAGTSAGLAAVAGGRVVHLGAAKGLPDGEVSQLLDDGRGHLWLGTRRGLTRARKTELLEIMQDDAATVNAVHYADGVAALEAHGDSQPAMLRLRDGRLAFATVGGVAVVSLDVALGPGAPPVVEIRDIRRQGRSLLDGRVPAVLTVPAGGGPLEIELVALSLAAPERNRLRFKLEGLDRDFRVAGPDRLAVYANVPPGAYTFHAVGADHRGAWSRRPLLLAITSRPRFHQTAWFPVLLSALVVAGAAGAHRLRSRAQQRRHTAIVAERGRLAREMHDSLDQALVGVGLQVDAARRALPPGSDAHDLLAGARAMIAEAQDETQRLVWDLRALVTQPGTDLAGVLAEMADRWRSLFGGALDLRIEGTPRPLRPDVQSEMLRIAQEAVTNAIRHAAPSRIDLHLVYERRRVTMSIQDDGRGFDVAHRPAGRFGVVGMEERARAIRAVLRLESREGEGTRLHLEVAG